MNKHYALLLICITSHMLYAQVNDGKMADIQDSLNIFRNRINSYKNYYNKMIRLSDEESSEKSKLSLYVINGRKLGRPFLISEIDASKKESPEAVKLFKKANGCNVSSNILSFSGAIMSLFGLPMILMSFFSEDPQRMLGAGLTLSAVGISATLIALPISNSGIMAKRNGYLQYDKDLRHKYGVPSSINIE